MQPYFNGCPCDNYCGGSSPPCPWGHLGPHCFGSPFHPEDGGASNAYSNNPSKHPPIMPPGPVSTFLYNPPTLRASRPGAGSAARFGRSTLMPHPPTDPEIARPCALSPDVAAASDPAFLRGHRRAPETLRPGPERGEPRRLPVRPLSGRHPFSTRRHDLPGRTCRIHIPGPGKRDTDPDRDRPDLRAIPYPRDLMALRRMV